MLMTPWDVDTEIGVLHLDKWHQRHKPSSKHLEGRTVWRREECSGHVMLLGTLGKDGIYGWESLASPWLTYLRHDSFGSQMRHPEWWTSQRGNAASSSIGFQGQTCLLLSLFFLSLLFCSLPSSLFSGLAAISAPLHTKWPFLPTSSKPLVHAIWNLAPKSLMLGSTLNFLSVCCQVLKTYQDFKIFGGALLSVWGFKNLLHLERGRISWLFLYRVLMKSG